MEDVRGAEEGGAHRNLRETATEVAALASKYGGLEALFLVVGEGKWRGRRGLLIG